MTQKIKATFCNVSLGTEIVRIFDSKNEALMYINSLLIKEIRKLTTDEVFIRYESYVDIGDKCENSLLF